MSRFDIPMMYMLKAFNAVGNLNTYICQLLMCYIVQECLNS
jgi:hypothetical protein